MSDPTKTTSSTIDFTELLANSKIKDMRDMTVAQLVETVDAQIEKLEIELTEKENANTIAQNGTVVAVVLTQLENEKTILKDSLRISTLNQNKKDQLINRIMQIENTIRDLTSLSAYFSSEKGKLDTLKEDLEGNKNDLDLIKTELTDKAITAPEKINKATEEKDLQELTVNAKIAYAKKAQEIVLNFSNFKHGITPQLIANEIVNLEESIIEDFLDLYSANESAKENIDHTLKLINRYKTGQKTRDDVFNQLDTINDQLIWSPATKQKLSTRLLLSNAMSEFSYSANEVASNDIDNKLMKFLEDPFKQKVLNNPTITTLSKQEEITQNDIDDAKSTLKIALTSATKLDDIKAIYIKYFPSNKEILTSEFNLRIALHKNELAFLTKEYEDSLQKLQAAYGLDDFAANAATMQDPDFDILYRNKNNTSKHEIKALRKVLNIHLKGNHKTAEKKAAKEDIANLEKEVQNNADILKEFHKKEEEQIKKYKRAFKTAKGFLALTKSVLSSLFQPGKKLVDLSDDVWYAIRNFFSTLPESIGNYIIGGASGAVALGETSLSVKEAKDSLQNVNATNAVYKGAAGAATAVTAGTAFVGAATLLAIAAGVAVFGALTATMAIALSVTIPTLMTVTYGIRLAREAYHLHLAKKEEKHIGQKLEEVKEAHSILETAYLNGPTPQNMHALMMSHSRTMAVEARHVAAKNDRLTAERDVAFTATEFATSAIVAVGVILGTAAIVGLSIATLGVGGGIALATVVTIVGVGCGFGAKIFEKVDEYTGHKCTKWLRDKIFGKDSQSTSAASNSHTNKPKQVVATTPSTPSIGTTQYVNGFLAKAETSINANLPRAVVNAPAPIINIPTGGNSLSRSSSTTFSSVYDYDLDVDLNNNTILRNNNAPTMAG